MKVTKIRGNIALRPYPSNDDDADLQRLRILIMNNARGLCKTKQNTDVEHTSPTAPSVLYDMNQQIVLV